MVRWSIGAGASAAMVSGQSFLLGLAGKLLLDGMLELRIFSEIICRFMLPCNACLGAFPGAASGRRCAAAQGTECRGQNGGNPSFSGRDSLCFWCFWRWRLLRGMRAFCRCLAFSFGHRGRACRDEHCILGGSFFLYFIYPDLKKACRLRSLERLSF